MTAEEIVLIIASGYWELSGEKIRYDYNRYKTLCEKYVQENTHGPIQPYEHDFYDDF